jgi:polyadenylate-binding protein 2
MSMAEMRRMIAEKQAELARLKQQQEAQGPSAAQVQQHQAAQAAENDTAARSVAVLNVPATAIRPVVEAHFGSCGAINRMTLLQEPGGVQKAYIEFEDRQAAARALMLTGSALMKQQIVVSGLAHT